MTDTAIPTLPSPEECERLISSARLTIGQHPRAGGLSLLALSTRHGVDPQTPHPAYCSMKGCHYGRRFFPLDRFERAWIMLHEQWHYHSAHIARGKLLELHLGAAFSWQLWNIITDCVINHSIKPLTEDLRDRAFSGERLGERVHLAAPEGFGVVEHRKLVDELRQIARLGNIIFDERIALSPGAHPAEDLYAYVSNLLDAVARSLSRARGKDQETGEASPPSHIFAELMRRMSAAVDAHDDMDREGASGAAVPSDEESLRDEINARAREMRGMAEKSGANDLLRSVVLPNTVPAVPWERVMDSVIPSLLRTAPTVNRARPSRRMLAAMSAAQETKDPTPIAVTPRTRWAVPAKKLLLFVDISRSVDDALLARFVRHIENLARRTSSHVTVAFFDDAVRDVFDIGFAHERITQLRPRQGGFTDFRPCFDFADKMAPDVVGLFTDLEGAFPKKRRFGYSIFWAKPGRLDGATVPFGRLLALG